MAIYPKPIDKLIECLVKLPGIGRRSAERIVNHLLHTQTKEVENLSEAILQVKKTVHLCRICGNLSDEEVCSICQDSSRNHQLLCIVEKPQDVIALEKTGSFKGVYHVLGKIHSSLQDSGLQDSGPSHLEIGSLLARIKREGPQEIILALDADTPGQASSLYLSQLLKPTGIKLTRLAIGIPSGMNLEYTDSSTLAFALNGRQPI
ncbi:MAG: recombination protein RecR [Candidatus Omnitrophica bacterium]|nr:recombination protein RecR [Candidatus Omnitrophota bacterium]